MHTLEPNLMVWAFKTELWLILHKDEYIKSQKEMETRKQLWTDCEPAMSCCKPSLTLQHGKCWDNVQQLPCQKPTCRKLSSSLSGATHNAHKCPSLITWCMEKGQNQSDKHERCNTRWHCVCSRTQLWMWARTWVVPKHWPSRDPRTWPALLLQRG